MIHSLMSGEHDCVQQSSAWFVIFSETKGQAGETVCLGAKNIHAGCPQEKKIPIALVGKACLAKLTQWRDLSNC